LAFFLPRLYVMKVMFVSRDHELIERFKNTRLLAEEQLNIFNESSEPLDVMSSVCSNQPAILILDDDFVQPNSVKILKSIRQVHQNIKIIFVTSDTSIDLGREITPMGIHYYGIKPLDNTDLTELIKSVVAINFNKRT
jgi:DNA-binding NarL/FixJ family response regulator